MRSDDEIVFMIRMRRYMRYDFWLGVLRVVTASSVCGGVRVARVEMVVVYSLWVIPPLCNGAYVLWPCVDTEK